MYHVILHLINKPDALTNSLQKKIFSRASYKKSQFELVRFSPAQTPTFTFFSFCKLIVWLIESQYYSFVKILILCRKSLNHFFEINH